LKTTTATNFSRMGLRFPCFGSRGVPWIFGPTASGKKFPVIPRLVEASSCLPVRPPRTFRGTGFGASDVLSSRSIRRALSHRPAFEQALRWAWTLYRCWASFHFPRVGYWMVDVGLAIFAFATPASLGFRPPSSGSTIPSSSWPRPWPRLMDGAVVFFFLLNWRRRLLFFRLSIRKNTFVGMDPANRRATWDSRTEASLSATPLLRRRENLSPNPPGDGDEGFLFHPFRRALSAGPRLSTSATPPSRSSDSFRDRSARPYPRSAGLQKRVL